MRLSELNLANLPDVIRDANKRFAQNEARSLRQSVVGWSSENRPEFFVEVSGDDYIVKAENFKVYDWVDKGTEPHEITPKGEYPLRIRGGGAFRDGAKSYLPMTEPQRLSPVRGSAEYYEKDSAAFSVVQNIEARGFTEIALEEAPDRWERAIDFEIEKYLKENVS